MTAAFKSGGLVALLSLLRGCALSPSSLHGMTWGTLCGDTTLQQFLHLIDAVATVPGITLASWNVRWLVDPHTLHDVTKQVDFSSR